MSFYEFFILQKLYVIHVIFMQIHVIVILCVNGFLLRISKCVSVSISVRGQGLMELEQKCPGGKC